MIGIEDEPQQVGMGIWRTVAKRPAEMECSELYYGGPKYKAGYTPISDDLCYAFLLEENLDRSFVGEGPNGGCSRSAARGTAASGARCATAWPTTRSSTTSGSRPSASSSRGSAAARSSSATPRTPARR